MLFFKHSAGYINVKLEPIPAIIYNWPAHCIIHLLKTTTLKGARMTNKKLKMWLAAIGFLSVSTATYAQEGTTWFGDTADGQWLAGIKYGSMTNDDPGFQDADAYTLVLGYQFARPVGDNGSSSIELELTDTEEADLNNGISNGFWDATTIGLFITYRTPGTVYFKGKVGLLASDLKAEINEVDVADTSDVAFAYGAGLGVRLGAQQNVNLELEWTGASGEHDLSHVTIGGQILF